MKYRPEIDGLRALAVLAVVIYHADFGYLSGGYLGVDVFFVISGFLITQNIVNEARQANFKLLSFYNRRLRRLLPVLFLVLAVSSFYAWEYLLPADLVEFSNSLLSALAFVSNFFFYAQDNYHAAASASKPLLHTWSLGVEEQFYIFFPLTMVLIASLSNSKKALVFLVVALVSICFAQYTSSYYSELGFFLLPTRLWELLTGAVLALLLVGKKLQAPSAITAVIPLAGLTLVFLSIGVFDSSTPHPSFITLLPVLGTAAVLGWGRSCSITTALIGNRVSAWVGRLSYSIYLWHFPVFAFVKSKTAEIAVIDKVELLILILLLSCISYYLIEKPFRNQQRVPNNVFYIVLICVGFALAGWSFHVAKNGGFESRLGDIESIFEGTDRNDSYLTKDGRRCYFNPQNPKSCKFVGFDESRNMISMGDSHANMISVPLQKYAAANHYNFYNMVLSHCPYIESAWRHTGFKAKCETSQMDEVREYMKGLKPSIIVYTVRWPMYLNRQPFDNREGGKENSLYLPFYPSEDARRRGQTIEDLIVTTFSLLVEMGHSVVLVYPTPEVGWHVPKLIKTRLDDVPDSPVGRKRKAFEAMSITTSYSVYKERVRRSKLILDKIQHPRIKKVYPDSLFCSEMSERCVTHDKNSIFYYDDDHLSQVGAAKLVKLISKKILELEMPLQ